MRLSLRNPDFTTAKRMEEAINRMLGNGAAVATNPATVELALPHRGRGDVVTLLTEIEQLRVDADQPAKIVINEESGIIVMGSEVRVSKVAIAQGNLTIKVTEAPQASQPNPLAGGDTVVLPRSDVQVDDSAGNKLAIVDETVSLQSLVDGLNALGIGPRDMISILQAIKASGALQAEIEVM
jgi:flagellar P-ring protein precursor FlgI